MTIFGFLFSLCLHCIHMHVGLDTLLNTLNTIFTYSFEV